MRNNRRRQWAAPHPLAGTVAALLAGLVLPGCGYQQADRARAEASRAAAAEQEAREAAEKAIAERDDMALEVARLKGQPPKRNVVPQPAPDTNLPQELEQLADENRKMKDDEAGALQRRVAARKGT